MKCMKRMVALLTMVAVLAMGMTAFAAEPTGIGFEQTGLSCNMQIGVPMVCMTTTYEYETIVYPYFIILSDEIIQADEVNQFKPGYEWRKVSVMFWSDEWDIYQYGIRTKHCTEDYYDIVYHDQTSVHNAETGRDTYSVIKDGVVYPECERYAVFGEWSYDEIFGEDGTFEGVLTTQYRDYYFCMPEGYDGTVIGFYNALTEWGEGQYIYDIADENTIFYRLQ